MLFATSGGSGFGGTVAGLKGSVSADTTIVAGKLLNGRNSLTDLQKWVNSVLYHSEQPPLVHGANLLQQDKGRLRQPIPGVQVIVGGQFGFDIGLAGDGGDDDCGTVLVAHVILDDNNGPVLR